MSATTETAAVTLPRAPDDAVDAPYAAQTHAWQERLLPFLQLMLAGLTLFFLLATLLQLRELQNRIGTPPQLELTTALEPLGNDVASLSTTDRLLFVQWRTLAELEKNALERRYHQANVLLMARTWTRYLGFLTGMILAFVGAAFILGRFRETATAVRVSSTPVKAALSTQSPGLVLATLGTALMMATILMHTDIETRDSPMYLDFQLMPSGDAAPRLLPGADVPESPDALLQNLGREPTR